MATVALTKYPFDRTVTELGIGPASPTPTPAPMPAFRGFANQGVSCAKGNAMKFPSGTFSLSSLSILARAGRLGPASRAHRSLPSKGMGTVEAASTRRLRALFAFVIGALLLVGVLQPNDGYAYVRYCKVDFAGRDLEIDVNKDVFEKYGIDPYEVRVALARAGREWATRVGFRHRIIVNGAYTTATQPLPGHVLVLASEAANSGALADAQAECPDGNVIRFFVQSWQYARGFRNDAGSGGSNATYGRIIQLYRYAVHELGHVLGMDHVSVDSAMNAPPAWRLTWDDINGMRSGTCIQGGTDSAGLPITCAGCTLISGTTYDCGYGVDDSHTMHAMHSGNDGSTWVEDHAYFVAPGAATNIEPSHTFGYNNTSVPRYGVAYVRATTAGDDRVRVISGNGMSWPADVDTGGVSTMGPAIAYGNTGSTNSTGWWVLAYVERNSTNSNELKYKITQDPAGTWSSAGTVTIGSDIQRANGRPYLAFSKTNGLFVLGWASQDTEQIYALVGYPASGSITWSNLTAVGGLDRNGGAMACVPGFGSNPTAGDCLVAWPHAGAYFPILSARGWTDPTFSNFKASPAKQVASDGTTAGIGVALKPDAIYGGAALAMIAARGTHNPYNWIVTTKNTTSPLTAWPAMSAPTGGATNLWTGVSMAYSTLWTEWTSVYSR